MKNLYPIFLFILIISSFLIPGRAEGLSTQTETLLILDRNYLYENNVDTLLTFIQELAQKQGSTVRIFEREKGKEDVYSLPTLLSVATGVPLVALFPNPANDMLYVNISGEKASETHMSIRSAVLGQPAWQTSLPPEALGQRVPVCISILSPGLYHVCVRTNEARIWKTFLKYD